MEMATVLGIAYRPAEGEFELVDVANHTDADQRSMVREIGYATGKDKDAKRQTLRRRTKLEKLVDAGVIDKRTLALCEWYGDRHAAAYDTVGITADYDRTGASGGNRVGRSNVQVEAAREYAWARAGINPLLVGLFERVVLHGRPMNRLGLAFRLACRQLDERIGHLVPAG